MVSRDEVPYPTQGTSYTASHGSSPRWGRDISANIVGANENIPRSPSVTWSLEVTGGCQPASLPATRFVRLVIAKDSICSIRVTCSTVPGIITMA